MRSVVHVLNGPNLNLLGKRQPHIYGHETAALERDHRALAAEMNLELRFQQSNREDEIIDCIHVACDTAAGIVITSNVHKREEVRHHSYVSRQADGVIASLGTQGYLPALRRTARLIDEAPA